MGAQFTLNSLFLSSLPSCSLDYSEASQEWLQTALTWPFTVLTLTITTQPSTMLMRQTGTHASPACLNA